MKRNGITASWERSVGRKPWQWYPDNSDIHEIRIGARRTKDKRKKSSSANVETFTNLIAIHVAISCIEFFPNISNRLLHAHALTKSEAEPLTETPKLALNSPNRSKSFFDSLNYFLFSPQLSSHHKAHLLQLVIQKIILSLLWPLTVQFSLITAII